MFVLCCMFVTTWLISTLRVSCSNHSPLFHTSVAGLKSQPGLKFLHVISPLHSFSDKFPWRCQGVTDHNIENEFCFAPIREWVVNFKKSDT